MNNADLTGRRDKTPICTLVCVLLIVQGFPVVRAAEARATGDSTGSRVLSLDGKTGCVRVSDSQSLRSFSDAITIEVWLKASSFCAENGGINSIVRKNIVPGAENFLLRFRNVDNKPALQMGLGDAIGVLQAPYDFTPGTWCHLAGTYDGHTITILVNGLPVASQNLPGRLHIDPSDLYVGKGDPTFSSGEYFHGDLDEIRLWNIARSQEQIQAAMNTALTGKEKGLVAYWNFDDGTAKDLSGHGNDGVLSGNARIVESSRSASIAVRKELPNKLIAWWKFENDANDSAGTNHGTVHGNPVYVDGKVGRAISLDGDDYVDCGNPDSLNVGTGDWTISAWIKTTQSGIEDTDKGTVFAKGADGGGGIRYALAVNEGQLGSITLTTDNDVYKVQAISRTAVNDGAWHHVVGLRNAAQLRVYVDGTLDAGGYLPAGYDLSGTSQRNASIGVITDYKEKTLIKYFVGQVDEVCVFGGAIDANGVGALFSGKDPAAVAQTAIVAGASAAPPKRTGGVPSPSGEIEGNWQVVSSQVSQKAVLEIRKKSDGTLDATIVTGTADEGPQSIPLSEVTFEERKLSFRIPSNQGSFEGTMNEDGSAIEGQFTQGEQAMTLVLQRMAAVQPKATTIAQGQIPERTGGTGNTATTLILILALAGVIGAVVLFIVKSSIRK